MADTKKIRVTGNGDEPIPTEILADSIIAISQGMRKLRGGRLNDKALFLLIQHASPSVRQGTSLSKPTIADITAVFAGIEDLERTFLKKKPT